MATRDQIDDALHRWVTRGRRGMFADLGHAEPLEGPELHSLCQRLAGDVIGAEGIKRILKGEVQMPRGGSLVALYESIDSGVGSGTR